MILTVNDKYSLSLKAGLMKPIQMLLSQNQKIFSEFFSTLLESTKQLEYFEKKDESQKLFSSDIINSKKRG